jgi:hypothetical protein
VSAQLDSMRRAQRGASGNAARLAQQLRTKKAEVAGALVTLRTEQVRQADVVCHVRHKLLHCLCVALESSF